MGTVPESPSYPPMWRWEEGKKGEPADGDTCAGRFVRFDKGATRDFGKKLILVLEVEGSERSVWLLETALVNKVRDELADRPGHTFKASEPLVIRRLEKTRTQDGAREYHPYGLYCPERPQVSPAEFFGFEQSTGEQEDGQGVGATDDIPF